MIWVKNDSEGNKQIWYSEDVIKVLKALCLQKDFISSNVILQIIKDYENV